MPASDDSLEVRPKLELKLVLELGYDTKLQIETLQKRMTVLEKRAKELQSVLSPDSKLREKVFGEKPNTVRAKKSPQRSPTSLQVAISYPFFFFFLTKD